MNLVDIIVIGILVFSVIAVIYYIVKENKKGNKCIGCPMASSCAKNKKKCG